MSNIQIAVSAADAAVTAPATLTSGMVGATVTFAFSGTAWQSLRKIAVFRAGSVRRDVEETDWSGSVCTIPWECLSEADERLLVGVYGMDEAGTVVIPTVYADCGWIWPGADPAGDPAADPTGPFYAGLLAEALEKAKASGAFDGPAGPQGDKGDPGDSYTVKGLYATLADLQAAHPTGSAGDAWFVGTAEDNVVYQWDVDQAAWVNVGALKGPQGETGATGAAGADGADGADGKSAYQSAKDGGYTGTEAQFNTDLAAVSGKQARITASGLLKGDGAGGVSAAVKGADYAGPSVSVSATLTAAGWDADAKTQTVSVAGVTATANGSLRIAQSATDDQFTAWGAAQPRATAQADGSITVKLAGTVPTIDIPVEVLIVCFRQKAFLRKEFLREAQQSRTSRRYTTATGI